MTNRRQYSREFKVQAVQMVTEQGLGVSEVAQDLGGESGNDPQVEVVELAGR